MDKNEIIRQLRVALPIYQGMEEYSKKMKAIEMKKARAGLKGFLALVISFVITTILISVPNPLLTGLSFIPENAQLPVAAGIWFGIPVIVFIIIFFLSESRANKRKEEAKTQLAKENQVFVQNNYCPELLVLPPDYRYATACNYILGCFENMRADTMKEAINLYVEQIDRWKQEQLLKNIQSHVAEIQREQASANDFFETAILIGLMNE